MKINKKELRQIIREERVKLLNESKAGHAIGLGFEGYRANRRPDFARAYGKDAKSIGAVHQYASLSEQPVAVGSTDPVEAAYQELKHTGAYTDLKETLNDSLMDLENLFEKHSDLMVQADQGSLLDALQEVMDQLDNLKQTFSALR